MLGDWGLGIGDWGLCPIPNPQSPIPNPHYFKLLMIKRFDITLFIIIIDIKIILKRLYI